MARAPVTLQISLAPTDLPHAKTVLPHQLRCWADQVSEVVLTVDGLRGAARGRFAEGWEERRPGMQRLLDECAESQPHARVVEVGYGQDARRTVAERLTGGAVIPEKDSRGGPYYAYMFGLHEAAHDLVLHVDSDMLFGGGSQAWVSEAVALMREDPDVLVCNPLGGPPTEDPSRWIDPREPHASLAFRASSISTRIFLIDRERLRRRAGPLVPRPPSLLRSRLKARLHGNPPYALPEDVLTEAMHASGMRRVDLLGSDPGMWSLHPPFRSERFYAELPAIVSRIEAGDVPDAQRGDYDLNDSMIDWSDARAAFRRRRWIA